MKVPSRPGNVWDFRHFSIEINNDVNNPDVQSGKLQADRIDKYTINKPADYWPTPNDQVLAASQHVYEGARVKFDGYFYVENGKKVTPYEATYSFTEPKENGELSYNIDDHGEGILPKPDSQPFIEPIPAIPPPENEGPQNEGPHVITGLVKYPGAAENSINKFYYITNSDFSSKANAANYLHNVLANTGQRAFPVGSSLDFWIQDFSDIKNKALPNNGFHMVQSADAGDYPSDLILIGTPIHDWYPDVTVLGTD